LNHYTIRELLRPLEQTAVLCGMRFLPPYTLFGARTAVEEGRVVEHVEGWVAALEKLTAGEIDVSAAEQTERLQQLIGLEGVTS